MKIHFQITQCGRQFVRDAVYNVLQVECLYIAIYGYSRTHVERPPSPTTIPLIRPYFIWRTLFSVCSVPDQRTSLKRDQRPGQMGFSPSRTTTSSTCISKNRWWHFNIRSQCMDVTSLLFCQPAGVQTHVLHPGSSYYQRQCNMMFYVKCYVNTLSNIRTTNSSSLSSAAGRAASSITSWLLCVELIYNYYFKTLIQFCIHSIFYFRCVMIRLNDVSF